MKHRAIKNTLIALYRSLLRNVCVASLNYNHLRYFWTIAHEGGLTLAAERLTFGAAFIAALIDVALGLVVAWALARRRFAGRSLLDALVDIPFAFPTAVTGITLASLYGIHGWIGAPLAAHGIAVASTPLGIGIALAFVGFPFVVRSVQPVIAALPRELEEAAETLGASRGVLVRRVLFPLVLPALVSGFALALARGLGEYGSVVFVAGNFPYRTEVVPFLIMARLQEFDDRGAAALAIVALVSALIILLVVNVLQRRLARVRTLG